MTRSTDAIIEQLARSAEAVERLGRPWHRTVRWVGLSLPFLALALLAWPGAQPFAGTTDWRFIIEQGAALLTGVTAAVAAFATTVPGYGRRVVALPGTFLGVWLLTVGQGCARDLAERGATGWLVGAHWPCLVATVMVGAAPAAAMVLMLRRGAPLAPRLTAVLGGIAAAGLANFTVRFVHAADASVIVLVWHIGAVGAAVGLLAASGRRIFSWATVLQRASAP